MGNTAKKISHVNWKSSMDKWDKAVEKTRNRENFDLLLGFKDLIIVGNCGYCVEHYYCSACSLKRKKICGRELDEKRQTVFWQYVEEMEKSCYNPDDVDWDRALMLAEKIRDAIAEDEPKKIKITKK